MPAFTARSVELTKPDPSKRLELPDGALPGFYLVVQPSGAKSWAVRYRIDGKSRKMTLGPYPRLGLGDARERARTALQAVSEGRDPAGEKVQCQTAWNVDPRSASKIDPLDGCGVTPLISPAEPVGEAQPG
ncbi:Arm DNA-binding domain-containing protein [Methylobacterium sp. WSM2598]|uniref:Arm DNA-binding domain-containing protein n=1 Tax=Methylobacterium sp. WSM2598 TaxID=398261 RepID=UPI00039ECD5C|nr:Arm DNA-binding domain-containing protein [Methylobacterium sp. WSM2598]